jgi:hypothetical protein
LKSQEEIAMSMEQGRANFEKLLAEKENKVIALSGRWGTGKSHMWREAQRQSADESIKKALYVSLFGLRSVTELKLKVAQGAIPVKAGAPWMETMKSFVRAATQVAKGFHSSFSALDEIALLAVPKMLEGRFIVIDDIERKHEKLSIDEVLGLIDDFTQNYKCRILLILNTDQLADKSVWDKFREKVIDQELRLETSPAEAFDIAAADAQTPFAAAIRAAVEVCGLTNIRTIRKVIRVVARILNVRPNLPPEVLARVIPSTVLLSAIHYKAIDGGPDMDYVLRHNEDTFLRRAVAEAAGEQEGSAQEAQSRAAWDLLLEKLNINGADEYEVLVARYLASGQFDSAELGQILERYCSEEHLLATQNKAKEFFQRARWQPELTEAQLLAEAAELVPDAHLLSPSSVTSLHDYLSKLQDGAGVADDLIARWVDGFKAKPLEEGDAERFEAVDMFDRPHHPAVVAAYEEVRAALHAERPLADVIIGLSTSNGWGNRDEAALKAATTEDFEAAIKTLTGPDLKRFLLKSMDLYTHQKMYAAHFGSATGNFLAACKKVRADEPGSRRANLLKSLFDQAKASEALEGAAPASPTDAAPAPLT